MYDSLTFCLSERVTNKTNYLGLTIWSFYLTEYHLSCQVGFFCQKSHLFVCVCKTFLYALRIHRKNYHNTCAPPMKQFLSAFGAFGRLRMFFLSHFFSKTMILSPMWKHNHESVHHLPYSWYLSNLVNSKMETVHIYTWSRKDGWKLRKRNYQCTPFPELIRQVAHGVVDRYFITSLWLK